MYVNTHLVGGLVAIFYFPIYWEFPIIPIDELIFFRGVARNHQPVVCDLGFPAFDTHPLNAHFFRGEDRAGIIYAKVMRKDHEQIPPENRHIKKTNIILGGLMLFCFGICVPLPTFFFFLGF